ncbi:conserved hypothetical protein [delta proteobacterium NaphS2]|nr:conserved hypothetical protein [delta proteobacterium NaphS2]
MRSIDTFLNHTYQPVHAFHLQEEMGCTFSTRDTTRHAISICGLKMMRGYKLLFLKSE